MRKMTKLAVMISAFVAINISTQARATPMPVTVGEGGYLGGVTDTERTFSARYILHLTTFRSDGEPYTYDTDCSYDGTYWSIESCNVNVSGGTVETLSVNGTFVHKTDPDPGESTRNAVSFGLSWDAGETFHALRSQVKRFDKKDNHEVGLHDDRFWVSGQATTYPNLGGDIVPVYWFDRLILLFSGTHPIPLGGSASFLAGAGMLTILLARRKWRTCAA